MCCSDRDDQVFVNDCPSTAPRLSSYDSRTDPLGAKTLSKRVGRTLPSTRPPSIAKLCIVIANAPSSLKAVLSESQTQQTNAHPLADPSDRDGQFQWTKQWYPVAVVEFLDPDRPHAIQVIGIDMVLWRDGSGAWRCFEDVCPHRLAPLSEERVEADGTLLCAYHAWRFNGEGQCVSLPQSKDAATEATHCANPKARAMVYATQERQGLLWVWAEAGAAAELESQQRDPRLIPELDDTSGHSVKAFWNIRDLPYGWDFFMENVADPAHVPVSHHGLVGDRYQDAKYYDMPRLREISTQEGFAFAVTPTAPTIQRTSHDFQPPCLMRIETTFSDGGSLLLILYATPTRPGWCRHIGRQVLLKNAAGKTPPGLAFFALPMPTWLGHVLASLFLHQDLVFLHHQERRLAKRQGRWLEQVYTPNPQDKMVITFRQWLENRAGGGIPWSEHYLEPIAGGNHRALFDVWGTHTQHCHTCQRALKRITWLITGVWGGALFALFLAVFLDARFYTLTTAHQAQASLWQMPPLSVLLLLGVAVLLGISGYWLKQLRQLFYVYEFHHADND